MQLATSSVVPMVVKATVELGVLEILAREGPDTMFSPSQIASKIPVKNNPDTHDALDKMLSLLASHSILSLSGKGSTFRLLWEVLEGVPFERARGVNAFSYLGKDARFSEIFKDSMKEYNKLLKSTIMDAYRGFEGLNSLVDVGGGNGSILSMIISKYPHIKGINFDLASVIKKSPSYSGDMFVSIPRGDAIFMKWMLHTWSNELCIKILKNCYDALPDCGKVMVVDMVIPETPGANLASASLFQMYVFITSTFRGGKERTEREFENLATKAGFSGIRVAYRAHNFSPVELDKNAESCQLYALAG
ncbi:hypothetical protein NL676_009895 [Syzygium grande]|nr:hypothetical protein NL676_009895 [Syzygium grande]